MHLKFSNTKGSNVSASSINEENNSLTVQRGVFLAVKLVSTVYAVQLKKGAANAKKTKSFKLM